MEELAQKTHQIIKASPPFTLQHTLTQNIFKTNKFTVKLYDE